MGMDTRPPGPWVLVVGMHRSGTSAVTGALSALGFEASGEHDRVEWLESNPEHWESLSLSVYDNQLLFRLGGSWDAPPEKPEDWPKRIDTSGLVDPRSALAAAFPGSGPFVWKDPRLCLLLPYWRAFLPEPLAVVFIWRSPMAVAHSLRKRDDMDLAHGLALWERYNRSAMANLQGIDTYVADYEQLTEHPGEFVRSIAEWLGSLSQFAGREATWNVEEAAATLTTGTSQMVEADADLLNTQRVLVETLTMSKGGHRPLTVEAPGNESPWTTALIKARRESRTRDLDKVQNELAYWKRAVDDMVGSTSWRITRPMRSVISLAKHKNRPTPKGATT
jgi:hypothetical protein